MIALVVAIATPALAWQPTGMAPGDEQLPAQFEVSRAEEETLDEGESLLAFVAAADTWRTQGCHDFNPGLRSSIDGPALARDGTNTVHFNDPDGTLPGGVLALSFIYSEPEVLFVLGGREIRRAIEFDIVVNDNVEFGTADEVQDPGCTRAFDLQTTFVHELGHVAGLGHTCENGEPCDDALLREAVMYWSVGECEVRGPNADDIEGVETVVGPIPGFACGAEPTDLDGGSLVGYAPVELYCDLDGRNVESVLDVRWDPGDGTVSTDSTLHHTFSDAGTYDVTACVDLETSCGTIERCPTRQFAVSACPEVALEFEVQPVGGLFFEIVNHTAKVPGCYRAAGFRVERVGGDVVFDGPAWEPIFEVPDAGSYVARFAVEAFDGSVYDVEVAFEGEFLDLSTGCGCGGVGGSPAGGLAVVLSAVLGLVRRRRSVGPEA